jgi:hypothetical protein
VFFTLLWSFYKQKKVLSTKPRAIKLKISSVYIVSPGWEVSISLQSTAFMTIHSPRTPRHFSLRLVLWCLRDFCTRWHACFSRIISTVDSMMPIAKMVNIGVTASVLTLVHRVLSSSALLCHALLRMRCRTPASRSCCNLGQKQCRIKSLRGPFGPLRTL